MIAELYINYLKFFSHWYFTLYFNSLVIQKEIMLKVQWSIQTYCLLSLAVYIFTVNSERISQKSKKKKHEIFLQNYNNKIKSLKTTNYFVSLIIRMCRIRTPCI